MISGKIVAACGRACGCGCVPFVMLSTADVSVDDVGGIAGIILKYGELGLCLVLVTYLIWSNWSLVNSLQKTLKDKTAQEERLIGALHEFCCVCRERPCLIKSPAFDAQNIDGIIQSGKETKDVD